MQDYQAELKYLDTNKARIEYIGKILIQLHNQATHLY